ncbi:MAG: alternative ribosome rescue aminoacyl-tRNA hydrolase ArfB [Bacteroidota bacterium]
MAPDIVQITPELEFFTSRSSGPGGQNVNKVNSKVTLRWDLTQSSVLSAEQRDVLLMKWKTQLTKDGVLLVSVQESRSQGTNKEAAIAKLALMLKKAFEKKKARKATKPSKSAVQNRIEKKKRHSEKKKWRSRPE